MFLHKHFARPEEGVTEIDDIVRNLGYVLRTKRGCGYFLENFGLNDVGFRTPEEMVVALTAEIEENIRLFEPRVVVAGIDEEFDDAGHRTTLVVALKVRDANERVAIVVDLKKNQLDVRAVPARPDGSK